MAQIRRQRGGVTFLGVGGPAMIGQGLSSLFPMSDIAVMGIVPVVLRLRLLLRRIAETARAVIAVQPDVLVIIDSPDFTHRVAKRVRAAAPSIPIINYVSPTVWAWRSGRAAKMAAYVDHLLALLPFEPAAHRRLGGPRCTYVGHPLIRRIDELNDHSIDRRSEPEAPLILVLPGSRRSEIRRLMQPFGDAVAILARAHPAARFVLPAIPHVREEIERQLLNWSIKPEIIEGEAAKYAAFRSARVALAASGTVTLELALAHVPMVVGYKATAVEKFIFDHFVDVATVILPNLIIGAEPVPQFLQDRCTGNALAAALLPLIADGAARQAQLAAFDVVTNAMQIGGSDPSARAAEIVLKAARELPARSS